MMPKKVEPLKYKHCVQAKGSFRYSYQKSIIGSFRLACIFSIEYLTEFWVYGIMVS